MRLVGWEVCFLLGLGLGLQPFVALVTVNVGQMVEPKRDGLFAVFKKLEIFFLSGFVFSPEYLKEFGNHFRPHLRSCRWTIPPSTVEKFPDKVSPSSYREVR